MKSINQIFIDNKDLLNEPEVQELIEYCLELENEVINTRQDQVWSFEDKLAILVREIFDSIITIQKIEEENKRFRFNEKTNFEECVNNLKIYLQEFSRINNFRLH